MKKEDLIKAVKLYLYAIVREEAPKSMSEVDKVLKDLQVFPDSLKLIDRATSFYNKMK